MRLVADDRWLSLPQQLPAKRGRRRGCPHSDHGAWVVRLVHADTERIHWLVKRHICNNHTTNRKQPEGTLKMIFLEVLSSTNSFTLPYEWQT